MTDLSQALSDFGRFVDQDLDLDDMEKLIELDPSKIVDLPCVVQATNCPDVAKHLNHVLNILSEYAKDESRITSLNWNQLLEFIDPKNMLAFLSCLVQLGNMQPFITRSRSLALLAGQTVILMVSVPGADGCNAMLIERTLGLLNLLPKLAKEKPLMNKTEKQSFMNICVSLFENVSNIMLVHVHALFDDIKDCIMKVINTIVKYYWENYNCSYSTKLYNQCFVALDSMCQNSHVDLHETLNTIINGSLQINSYSPVTHSKGHHTVYATISDWFVAIIDKYPAEVTQQLTKFIKSILTNPPISSSGQKGPNNIDVCVTYDNELFRQHSISIVPFLREMEYSSNVMQRTNLVEFITKSLLAKSASSHGVCREIDMIGMLIVKINDLNDKVKVKAIAGFLRVSAEGNEQCRKIFKGLFKPERRETDTTAENSDSHSPPSTPSSVGCEATNSDTDTDLSHSSSMNSTSSLIKFYDQLLPFAQKNVFNHSAFVRAASIQLIEFLTVRTMINVAPFLESSQFRALNADTSMKVRSQMMTSTEKMLIARPNIKSVIGAYVRVTLDLAADNDEKVQDLVMNSFKKNVFDKIEVDSATTNEAPWLLLKDMLRSTDTKDVRLCIGKWMHKIQLTQTMLRNIESHTQSKYSAEAWILLSLVAPRITSRTPEMVVDVLKKNLLTHVSQSEDSYVQLEILSYWLKSIRKESQVDLQNTMKKQLLSGDIVPSHVQRVLELCIRIRPSDDENNAEWTHQLVEQSKNYIKLHANNLGNTNHYDFKLIHYIYIYGEALPELPIKNVDPVVADALYKFLRSVVLVRSKVSVDQEMAVKVICVLLFLSKCALFHYDLLKVTIPLIGKLLQNINHQEVIQVGITCLCDIFILNANMASRELPAILAKTQHESHVIRLASLQAILKLIYKEYIKLRGDCLMYILAALCDQHSECVKLAHDFLTKYTIEKDKKFMQLCLKETPFVLNNYTSLKFMKLFRLDRTLPSPVQGSKHTNTRQYIYKFCVYNMDVETCYSYFANLKLIYELFHEATTTMKQQEGLDATRDFLFVFTHICHVKPKPKGSANSGITGDPELDAEEAAHDVQQNAEESGRLKNAAQISKAALNCILEYTPIIAKLKNILVAIDPTMIVPIDGICWAISSHFNVLMDSAMPKEFWKKYQN